MFEQAITILELQNTIKRGLNRVLAPSYWVIAEIGNVNFASNGHCYLELVQRDENSSYTTAKISAAIWRYTGSLIENRFRKVTSSQLSVGMQILICAKVNYHELYGLSLVIIDIEPSYTLGEAERVRKETIEKLEKEGLLDKNKQLQYNTPLQRLAVISSAKAAGYGDFCNELFSSPEGFDYSVTLFNSTVQGTGAEISIINSLAAIYEECDKFDAIIIIRGGGSSDDLSCFNGYNLARMVAFSPLPVVVGVGHDRDLSIVDMVAKDSLKTPTATARFILDSTISLENELLELAQYLEGVLKDEVSVQKSSLERISHNFSLLVKNAVKDSSSNIEHKALLIQSLSKNRVLKENTALTLKKNRLKSLFDTSALSLGTKLDAIENQIGSGANFAIEKEGTKLQNLLLQIENFNPQRILELGYAIAKVNGETLRSGKELKKGETINIHLSDAVVTSEITKIDINYGKKG